jgi:hypothetical protein
LKFPFRELPGIAGGDLTPRPVVDVWLEGLALTGLACLVDTGALRTRFSAELAEIAGIDLGGAPTERFAVGGQVVEGSTVRITLRMKDGDGEHQWDAPVSFCRPWPFAFQLLGLEGFFQHFRVTISGYGEWVECRPES